jgi:UDP-arabinose 4-epimerase
MKQVILVTGGAGYIGSHTCKALANAGFAPVVIDNLSTGYRHNVKWGPLEVTDVSNKDYLRQVIRKHKPIAVMHFAGSAYVGESMLDPGKYYRNNTVATLAVLDVLQEENVQVLIFSSTCATYGLPEYLPVDVKHPQKPISPYGFSKYASEQMIIEYGRAHGLKYGLLRYFNAAGGDEDGDLKEEHCPETHLIPLALASAFGVGPKLRVFGTDYPTPDGTCIRDYIHVGSLADAHVSTLNRLLNGEAQVEIRNLGSGRGYSVKEILAAIERATGRKVDVEYGDRRPGDPPQLWAQPDAAFLSHVGDHSLDRIVLSASLAFKK